MNEFIEHFHDKLKLLLSFHKEKLVENLLEDPNFDQSVYSFIDDLVQTYQQRGTSFFKIRLQQEQSQ